MDDQQIIELYEQRSEAAIAETVRKYGRLCHSIAGRILRHRGDAEACVNDTWLRAWNAIPPQRPVNLAAFLSKITRNLALNMLERETARKRGSGQVPLLLDELAACLPAGGDAAQLEENLDLTDLLNRFLGGLPLQNRQIFLRRYWYCDSIREIAQMFRMGESQVKMILLRARSELRQLMQKEEII